MLLIVLNTLTMMMKVKSCSFCSLVQTFYETAVSSFGLSKPVFLQTRRFYKIRFWKSVSNIVDVVEGEFLAVVFDVWLAN